MWKHKLTVITHKYVVIQTHFHIAGTVSGVLQNNFELEEKGFREVQY